MRKCEDAPPDIGAPPSARRAVLATRTPSDRYILPPKQPPVTQDSLESNALV